MADGYIENKMAQYMAGNGCKSFQKATSLTQLLRKNRSHRGFDSSFKVRDDQLHRIIAVNTLIPSARNEQVLRFRIVGGEQAEQLLPLIHLGGALLELNLPTKGSEPNAFIVICSTTEESRYVDIDLGIAVQSMLLQAVEMGLNGICIGAFDRTKVMNQLGLSLTPLLIVALGRGTDRIELTEIGAQESHKYYRHNGIHYVPKVRIEDLMI